jgi:mannose-6-phosphate isomerase-like protein (cupin superfamily)
VSSLALDILPIASKRTLLKTDRQTIDWVKIPKGEYFELTAGQGTEETVLFMNGPGITEIGGKTSTVSGDSLVKMLPGKTQKIFNSHIDKLRLYHIQIKWPVKTDRSHEEPYYRPIEDCFEIVANPKERIYELFGKTMGKDGNPNGNAQMHSVALVEIAPGGFSEEHFHPIVEESYMIREGVGKLVIDSEERTVKPGDAVLIPVGKKHQIFNAGNESLKFDVVCVPPWTPDCGIYTKKDTL